MSRQRPNILLITSDQQHWNTLGITNPEICTPSLDRLAAQGVAFNRAYCANPTCTPTRASLITGQYPSQHGAWSLGTKLPETAHTIGEDFRAAGYRSTLIGKAHFQPLQSTEAYPSIEAYPIMQDLNFWRGFHGPWYGFDHIELARNHVDEAHVGQHYALWMEEKGFHTWRDHFRKPTGRTDGQHGRWSLPEEYHYNAWIAERTEAVLQQHRQSGQNFFLWASFFDPHPPYLVPAPWDTMYNPAKLTVPSASEGEFDRMPLHFRETRKPRGEADFSSYKEPGGQGLHGFHSHLQDRDSLARDIATYYGMVSLLDKYVGRILNAVTRLGLENDTLVVFTTDHGHFFGQHGLIAKGAFHYEDMLKVPLLVRWPGEVPAGQTSDALQSLVDIPSTFLVACGIPVPRSMTGLNQLNVWRKTQASVRDHVIVENRHNPTTVNLKTLITRRHKLTVYYNRPYGELFDLQSDPDERDNLWDNPQHASLKAELLLKFLHAEMGKEPMWMPRIAGA